MGGGRLVDAPPLGVVGHVVLERRDHVAALGAGHLLGHRLARQERVRGPTISGHIKALEAAGLVARTAPATGDRRRIGLLATDKGRTVIKTLKRRRTDWLARQLGGLSRDARRAIRDAIAPLSEIGL